MRLPFGIRSVHEVAMLDIGDLEGLDVANLYQLILCSSS